MEINSIPNKTCCKKNIKLPKGAAVAIVFALTAFLGIQIKNAKETESWTETIGKITKTEIIEETRKEQITDKDGHKRNYSKVVYGSIVRYEYSVESKSYISTAIKYGMSSKNDVKITFFNSHSEAVNFLNSYPIDSNITVFYNPKNPEEAVIEKGVSPVLYGMFGFFFVLTILLAFSKEKPLSDQDQLDRIDLKDEHLKYEEALLNDKEMEVPQQSREPTGRF